MIRYFKESDKAIFANLLLGDEEARQFMGLEGGGIWDISLDKHDRYKATFVLEDENPVGFVKVVNRPLSNQCCIEELYIGKPYRLLGWGKKLRTFAIDFCFNTWPEIKSVYAYEIDNKAMIHLNKTMGFVCFGTYKKFAHGRDQSYWRLERENWGKVNG